MEDRLIGSQLDSFRILEHLGRGGMADVYLAEDLGLRQRVVIKTMLPALAQNPELVARFQREAQATARLEHPNIVPVYTTGMTGDGRPYIAFQFIDGGSLEDYLAQQADVGQRISTVYALAICRQIADALAAAHAANIVHRDVKPSNILLRTDGTPVLADLGIAAVQDATQRLTQTGGVIGTPYYMSPEQASGKNVDGRSDIYSLGIILYELLSRQLPFAASSPLGVLHAHIYEPPTPLEDVRPGPSPQTYAIVARCLQKDPANRFTDAHALAVALDLAAAAEGGSPNIQAGTWRRTVTEPIGIGPTILEKPIPAVEPSRTRPFWLIPLAVVALLLLGAAAIYFLFLRPDQVEEIVATEVPEIVVVTATAEPTSENTAVSETPPQPIADAPTSATVFAELTFTVDAAQPRSQTGVPLTQGQIVSIQVEGGTWRMEPETDSPAIGPDGDTRIAAKNTFPVTTAPLGALIAGIGDAPPFEVGSQASFESPASGTLWLGVNDDDVSDNSGSLRVRITLGPPPETAVDSPAPPTPTLAPAPSGVLAFSCGTSINIIYLVDLTAGRRLVPLPGQIPNSIVPTFSRDGHQIVYRSDEASGWQIFVSGLDGANRRQITNGEDSYFEPVFAPDDSQFAIVSDKTGRRQIYIMRTDGSEERRLTFIDADTNDPTWSVDGRIAFESNLSGQFIIYVVDAAGGEPQEFIRRGASSSTPSWSLDGRQIAFEVRDGPRHIWIADAQGLNQLQVTKLGTQNQRPAWSPDGRFLAFASNYANVDEDMFDIWIVSLETGNLERITERGDCYDPAWGSGGAAPNAPTTDLPTGACALQIDQVVTAGPNARLWTLPDVTAGERLGNIAEGDRMRIIGGPEFGPVVLATGEERFWWQVEAGGSRGWVWQGRIEGCEE